jgi:ring-1,2-phenylacetyl-CoA epoxidase subunit PaaD
VTGRLTEEAVMRVLAEVKDPEIPTVSVVDLGMVHRVEVGENHVRVALLPTFVGCPALDLIRRAVAERLESLAPVVEVEATFAEPWTSDRITPDGRRKLRASGFAPPPPAARVGEGPLLRSIGMRPSASCPYCGSAETSMENPFGPTPCRAIFYCNACRQPFEQFKAV